MSRSFYINQLDIALEQYKVVLVKGLPGVGRSTFLADWKTHHTNVKHCQTIEDIELVSGTFILDHVDLQSIDEIVAIVRSADFKESTVRLVLAPNDLVTTERLRTTLAGIVFSIEMTPLRLDEIPATNTILTEAAGPVDLAPTASAPIDKLATEPHQHWVRGGLPASLASENDMLSMQWRQTTLDGLLARDYTAWRVERAFRLKDVFQWLANNNGSELDESGCPCATKQELKSAVHILKLLGLVRSLPCYPAGSNESLSKKQKLFVRDTGVLHALLGIPNWSRLRQSDKVIGSSFESYAIEALIHAGDRKCSEQFYRKKGSKGEEEIDLILNFQSQKNRLIAIEFKVGQDQKAKSGFFRVCTELGVEDNDRFVVHSGGRSVLDQGVPRFDLNSAIKKIGEIASDNRIS